MKRLSMIGLAAAAAIALSVGTTAPAQAKVFFSFGAGPGYGYGWHRYHPKFSSYCGWKNVKVRLWHHHRWVWKTQRVCY